MNFQKPHVSNLEESLKYIEIEAAGMKGHPATCDCPMCTAKRAKEKMTSSKDVMHPGTAMSHTSIPSSKGKDGAFFCPKCKSTFVKSR